MLIDILGAKCVGIEAVPVTVEVDITHGIGIHLVGLADVAVKESLLRTVTALQSLGFRIPGKKIVINLAPADVRKNGTLQRCIRQLNFQIMLQQEDRFSRLVIC